MNQIPNSDSAWNIQISLIEEAKPAPKFLKIFGFKGKPAIWKARIFDYKGDIDLRFRSIYGNSREDVLEVAKESISWYFEKEALASARSEVVQYRPKADNRYPKWRTKNT